MEDENENEGSVTATVKLSGEYGEIAEILAFDGDEYPELTVVAEEMSEVLEIVTRTGGATKSRIADDLPPGVAEGLDADSVIHVLRTLELYGLVQLDGNTWRPGPALTVE